MTALRIALIGLLVALGGGPAFGFACLGGSGNCIIWQSGQAPLKLFLGSPGVPLSNGSFSWDENAISAANEWNAVGTRLQFSYQVGGTFLTPCGAQGPAHACPNTGPIDDNPVLFSDSVCGDGFGDALALTINCFDRSARDMVNAPVFINVGTRWDAYDGALRGNAIDLRRVLAHEFGHVLGLQHPNEAGQSVIAIMNSRIGNIDRIQGDDVDGIRNLYGGGAPVPATTTGGCAVQPEAATSDGRALAAVAFLGAALRRRRRGRCAPSTVQKKLAAA